MVALSERPTTAAEMLRDYLHIKHGQNHYRHPGLSEWLCPLGTCPEIRREILAAGDAEACDYPLEWLQTRRAG